MRRRRPAGSCKDSSTPTAGRSGSAGRSCRKFQYTTTSSRLKDDVLFLVRRRSAALCIAACAWPMEGFLEERAAEIFNIGEAPTWLKSACRGGVSLCFASVASFGAMKRMAAVGRCASSTASSRRARPRRSASRLRPRTSLYVTDDFLVTHNTLNDAFIILDEAQNTTPAQMKMFLTRMGYGSQAVVNGDMTQVDLGPRRQERLVVAREILRGIRGDRVHRLRRPRCGAPRAGCWIVRARTSGPRRAPPRTVTAGSPASFRRATVCSRSVPARPAGRRVHRLVLGDRHRPAHRCAPLRRPS